MRLLKETGRTTTVATERLSPADREYVADVVARYGNDLSALDQLPPANNRCMADRGLSRMVECPAGKAGGVFYALYDPRFALVDGGAGVVLWMVGGSLCIAND